MIDKRNIDDRSMGEILASIRKIVTSEEASRRAGGSVPHTPVAPEEAGTLLLSEDMRVKKSADDAPCSDVPLAPAKGGNGVAREAAPKEPAHPSSASREAVSEAAEERSAERPAPPASEAAPDESGASAPSDPSKEQKDAPALASGVTLDEIETLVRRIVREELQGPIGMQINRKVKRMVRDEVTSAMDNDSIL